MGRACLLVLLLDGTELLISKVERRWLMGSFCGSGSEREAFGSVASTYVCTPYQPRPTRQNAGGREGEVGGSDDGGTMKTSTKCNQRDATSNPE